MAQDRRKIEYRTQGSAAYDPSFYVSEESVAQQIPAAKPRPRHKKQPVARQKMVVSPFALLGIAVSLLMLVLVLFGYAQVYESASQLGEMRDTVASSRRKTGSCKTNTTAASIWRKSRPGRRNWECSSLPPSSL